MLFIVWQGGAAVMRFHALFKMIFRLPLMKLLSFIAFIIFFFRIWNTMSQGIPLSSHLLPSYIIFKATLLNFSQKAMQETFTTKLKLNMCERAGHSINGLEWRTHTERNQVELVANAKRQTSMCECGERRGVGNRRWEMRDGWSERDGHGQFPGLKGSQSPRKTPSRLLKTKA